MILSSLRQDSFQRLRSKIHPSVSRTIKTPSQCQTLTKYVQAIVALCKVHFNIETAYDNFLVLRSITSSMRDTKVWNHKLDNRFHGENTELQAFCDVGFEGFYG